jgi:hypothetical protein
LVVTGSIGGEGGKLCLIVKLFQKKALGIEWPNGEEPGKVCFPAFLGGPLGNIDFFGYYLPFPDAIDFSTLNADELVSGL